MTTTTTTTTTTFTTNVTHPHHPRHHHADLNDGSVHGLVQETSAAGVVVETLTLTLIWVLSLVGNLLVCLVVRRSRRIQSTTNYFVVALALADACLDCFCLPFVGARVLSGSWKVGDSLCKLVRFVQHAVPSTVLLILLSICVDRFYTIIYPLSFKVTRGTAKRMVVFSWLTAGALSSLCFYFFDVVTIRKNDDSHRLQHESAGGSSSSSSGGRSFNASSAGLPEAEDVAVCPTFVPCRQWGGVSYVVLTVLLQFGLPVLALCVLYGRVARYIWRWAALGGSSSWRFRFRFRGGGTLLQRTAHPVPRAKVKMVKMLLMVTVTTLLLVTPFYGVQLGYCLHSERFLDAEVFIFAFWSLAATGASKPLIYLYCNSNFRRGCKEVFCMSAMRCYRSHAYAITSASVLGKKNHVGVLTTSTAPTTTITTTTTNAAATHIGGSGHYGGGGGGGGIGGGSDHHQPLTCYNSPLKAFNRAWHLEKTTWPLNGAAAPSTYV